MCFYSLCIAYYRFLGCTDLGNCFSKFSETHTFSLDTIYVAVLCRWDIGQRWRACGAVWRRAAWDTRYAKLRHSIGHCVKVNYIASPRLYVNRCARSQKNCDQTLRPTTLCHRSSMIVSDLTSTSSALCLPKPCRVTTPSLWQSDPISQLGSLLFSTNAETILTCSVLLPQMFHTSYTLLTKNHKTTYSTFYYNHVIYKYYNQHLNRI